MEGTKILENAIRTVLAEKERLIIRNRLKSGWDNFRSNGGKVGRKVGYRKGLEDYERSYPGLIQDILEKMRMEMRGEKPYRLYSVRSLAKQYNINPSTVQSLTNKLKTIFIIGKKHL